MILSGVLDRFLALKVVSIESDICWIPFVLDALAGGGERSHAPLDEAV
jgi:hypothetical protein